MLPALKLLSFLEINVYSQLTFFECLGLSSPLPAEMAAAAFFLFLFGCHIFNSCHIFFFCCSWLKVHVLLTTFELSIKSNQKSRKYQICFMCSTFTPCAPFRLSVRRSLFSVNYRRRISSKMALKNSSRIMQSRFQRQRDYRFGISKNMSTCPLFSFDTI